VGNTHVRPRYRQEIAVRGLQHYAVLSAAMIELDPKFLTRDAVAWGHLPSVNGFVMYLFAVDATQW
jgi:hypothetical protein